ncbi:MAG: D-alanine--D-alanine ligase [Oscillospiraceae bacterium]|nr:D-alanine--D-alanine ligase [Oscillospiraceae bacterium]
MKKKLLIVFGGVSSEYEISLLSASSVIQNVPKDKYEIVLLGVTRDGKCYLYTGDCGKIENNEWVGAAANLFPATISADRSVHGVTVQKDGAAENIRIDVAFPVLHGKNGEDGTIQGLFQFAGIPCAGCDALSSALCMDKAAANAMADFAGIAQAKWLAVTKYEYDKDPAGFRSGSAGELGFPLFVKPANAGSSVGVSKVKSAEELEPALSAAFAHDRKLVLEEGIDGIELECAVLGNDEILAPMVGEVKPCNEFYDYEAKYLAGESELYIPARISPEKFKEALEMARRVYRTMGCAGLSRVDMFMRKSDGELLFNEINTIPGFTSISMYSKMFAAAGVAYSELVDRIIELALERSE